MDNKIRLIWIEFACQKAEESGFKVEGINKDPNLIPDAILTKEGKVYHFFVAGGVYPDKPGFNQEELNSFHRHANANDAISFGCSVTLFNPNAKKELDLSDLEGGISAKINSMGIIGQLRSDNPFSE